MSRNRKITIKDCEYTITVMGGVQATDGFGVLAKHVLGPIGQLLASRATDDAAMLAPALRELGGALAAPDFRALVFQMLEGCTATPKGGKPCPLVKDGNTMILDGHFAGKIGEMLALVWFALGENYRNFFDALPDFAVLKARLQKLASSLESQISTTGESPG